MQDASRIPGQVSALNRMLSLAGSTGTDWEADPIAEDGLRTFWGGKATLVAFPECPLLEYASPRCQNKHRRCSLHLLF